MTDASFEVLLDRPDTLTGAPFPLRALVRLSTTPEASPGPCETWIREALESAMGYGQGRFGMLREEMPSGRAAVEDAARGALETALHRASHRLDAFELVELTPAGG
jgi:hypothetical protein